MCNNSLDLRPTLHIRKCNFYFAIFQNFKNVINVGVKTEKVYRHKIRLNENYST